MLYTSVSKFLNRWQPANLDEQLVGKSELKIRAKILTGLYLAVSITIILSGLFFTVLHLFGNYDFSIAITFLAGSGILLLVQMALFYYLGNIGASAIFFSMTFFGSTLGTLIFTGGWASPVRQLFFCAPMISFLVGGHNEGFYMTVLTLLIGLVMMAAHYMDFQIFQIIKPENLMIVDAVIWVASISLLVACLAVYDAILESYSKFRR